MLRDDNGYDRNLVECPPPSHRAIGEPVLQKADYFIGHLTGPDQSNQKHPNLILFASYPRGLALMGLLNPVHGTSSAAFGAAREACPIALQGARGTRTGPIPEAHVLRASGLRSLRTDLAVRRATSGIILENSVSQMRVIALSS